MPPLLARILYGGITEELLLRWGIMACWCGSRGDSFNAGRVLHGLLTSGSRSS